ncbi:AAA family ATPase [Treponema sp.]|uniref:cytidylate kinase-like family protein n=1 Tax=Treponema sp. TaxID=166 RepID=UPI00388FAC48
MAIISISRGIASSGNEIAERIAHNLGYRLITGTDVEAKIVHYGFPEEKLSKFNEKRPLFWHSITKERELYFNYLKLAILSFAEKDNCIFIGKGAWKILSDVPNHVSFNFTSPMEQRAQKISKERNINIHHAGVSIIKADTRRKDYYKDYFKCDVNDPNNYNLTITTSENKINQIGDMLSSMIKSYETEELNLKGIRKIHELHTHQKIINMLIIEKKLPITDLNIKGEKKDLVLTGLAESSAQVDRALDLIKLEYPDLNVTSEIRCVQDLRTVRK